MAISRTADGGKRARSPAVHRLAEDNAAKARVCLAQGFSTH